MKTLVGGAIAVAIGIIGVLVWWKSFFSILALALYLGFDELKDTWGKSDDNKDDDQYKSPVETPIKEVVAEPKKEKETKKEKEMTAGDTVLNIIEKNRAGVDVASLQKETGFTTKKIHNIVYKLKKQGKIISERKGFYKKA